MLTKDVNNEVSFSIPNELNNGTVILTADVNGCSADGCALSVIQLALDAYDTASTDNFTNYKIENVTFDGTNGTVEISYRV